MFTSSLKNIQTLTPVSRRTPRLRLESDMPSICGILSGMTERHLKQIELYQKIDNWYEEIKSCADKKKIAELIDLCTIELKSNPYSAYNDRILEDMYEEKWTPAIGYKDSYCVSNFGRVKSLGCVNHEESIKAQRSPKNIYPLVSIWKKNKENKVLVHRMTALALLPNGLNKKTVNHKYGCRVDSRVEYLEWSTMGENSNHSFKVLGRSNRGIKGKDHVRAKSVNKFSLNGDFLEKFDTVTLAAASVGVLPTCISAACSGKNKTSRGFKWEYA